MRKVKKKDINVNKKIVDRKVKEPNEKDRSWKRWNDFIEKDFVEKNLKLDEYGNWEYSIQV